MAKKADINAIVKCCEARFERGGANTWKHGDFNDLSREILRDTKVNISPNTLKRIFGKISVDEDYIPQQATIDALVKYGRYAPVAAILVDEIGQVNTVPALARRRRYWLIAVPLLMACLFGVFRWLTAGPATGSIKLSSTEGVIPATAFFELALPENRDSLFINFGDKSPPVYVLPGQKKATHNYLFPDVFKVSLQTRDRVIAETRVSITSDKWIGLSFYNQRDLRSHYYEVPAVKTGPDSVFNISNKQLHKMGLDTGLKIYTRLYNFAPVNYHADDFVFETTIKNALRRNGIFCNSAQFQISGMNGTIRFKLVSPGCSAWVLNILSEQRFDGKTDDLSRFVTDLEKWNRIRLVNRQKQVSLFVNDKLIYSGSYQRPLGEIKGVFVEFEGDGFVKNCYLNAPNGRALYHF